MTRTTSPAVSRRWLALEMKRLREERRLSQAKVAKALGCQVPKVSLLENGKRPLQDADLKTLLELFEIPDADRPQYFDELENAGREGWWERYDEATMPRWLAEFIGIEEGAVRLRAYQPALIHGLLQTPDYATGIYRGLTGDWSEGKVARYVKLRLRRQEMVLRRDDPAALEVVLDEAALHHMVGTREVMSAQLDHVVELCRANDNIRVHVMPFDRGGSYEAAYGSFTILGFAFPSDPGVVYMEHYLGGMLLQAQEDIDKYAGLFERLVQLSLSPDESLDALHAMARDYAG